MSYSKAQLEAMSGPELVTLYNTTAAKLAGDVKPVNKFADKETAVRRVQSILTVAGNTNKLPEAPKKAAAPAKKSSDAGSASTPKKPASAPAEPKVRGVRRKYFNFVPNKEIKPYEPDMKQLRGRLFVELKKGMSFDRAMEITREFDADRGVPSKNVERRAYEGTRLIHYYLGYGLRQDENQVIHLVEKK